MEVMLNLILVPSAKELDIHTNDNQGYLVVLHARPLRKRKGRGKEESGDHAYIESFSRNAIIAKNVTDNCKICMAGHTCACRKYGVA